MRFCVPEDGDLRWQCVTHYMLWHNIDLSTTLSVCSAAVAVVPVDRAALALGITALGAGLSLMLCQVTHFSQSYRLAVSLPQSLSCSHRKQSGWYGFFPPRGRGMLSPSHLFSLSVLSAISSTLSFHNIQIPLWVDGPLQQGRQVKD